MKQNNRQTLPLGRSTKKNNAGLSLLRPKLFTVVGDTYKYFNAIFQNIISKPIAKSISMDFVLSVLIGFLTKLEFKPPIIGGDINTVSPAAYHSPGLNKGQIKIFSK